MPQGLLLLGMVEEPAAAAPVMDLVAESDAPKKGKGAAKKTAAKAPKLPKVAKVAKAEKSEKPAKAAKEPKAKKKAAK